MPAFRRLPAIAICLLTLALASPALAQPSFSKTFDPDTIAAGSHSQLIFTITNGSGVPVINMAFSDTLPAAVSFATPPSASTDCGNGVVDVLGGTISLTDGEVAAFGSCTVVVDVTSTTLGLHTNTSGDLTSSAGNSGTATDDLTVVANRPIFSKSFSPTSIGFGGRSTLTFTIDNSVNPAFASGLTFTDELPTGLVIADPANASTDCLGQTFNATAGSTLITMFGGGFVLSGDSCTASVDVEGAGLGTFVNRSGSLFSSPGGPSVPSGFAVASLDVLSAGDLGASKSFVDDPVSPGATVELEFTLLNRSRTDSATGITFTDDLDATLSGLVATGLPASNVCGAGSTLTGTSTLTLTGGTLPAEGSCTFSVTLQVPAAASAGVYPNTTSSISGTIGGSPASGDPATDSLFVTEAPSITKAFLTDPVGAGDTVQLEFTITNISATSAATDITFGDNLSAFLSGATFAGSSPSPPCGAASTLTTVMSNGQTILTLFNGNLAPSASCTFTADLLIPANTPSGTFTNTTEPITATVDAMTQIGGTTTDTLTVAGAPRLTKVFTDDPVTPGGTVTLEFTLEHDAFAATDATNIAFTDDLNAALSGLAATGLPVTDICGVGSSLSGTTNLTFSGGTLAPGATCTFSVTLNVPAGALPGDYTNTTSSVTATVSGTSASASGGSDVLTVAGLEFTKEFIDDPLLPGGTGILRFTIDNTSTIDISGLFFSDNLAAALSGLTTTGGLPANPCGAGSTLIGPTNLVLVGGNLLAGTSCTFDVTVQVPGGAANGSYLNTTSSLTASMPALVVPPAADSLVVDDQILDVAKEFTNDPVAAGGVTTMEITITNLSATEAVTGITLTDDLDAMLSGAAAIGLPQANVCGAGSNLSGAGLVTLTGASLAPSGSCTITVAVQVPAAAPDGTYPNTTSTPMGMSSVGSVSGSAGTDDLIVRSLVFAKAFLSTAEPGQTVDLQFSISNPGSVAVSSLSFSDDLDAVLTGLVATGLPMSDACGAGSSLSGTSVLSLTNGNLGAGASCLITVTLQVPLTATVGMYPNTTSDLFASGLPVADPATDDLEIVAPASVDLDIVQSFSSSPVIRGQTVQVNYTITNNSPFAVTGMTFTEDFDAALTGLVATGLPMANICGTGSMLTGGATMTFTGGSLAPTSQCMFSVILQLPNTAPVGTVNGTTSDLDFTVAGAPFSAMPVTDSFDVALLNFVKAFQSNPVMPGDTLDLIFTITNPDPVNTITGLTFTDDLDTLLSGLTTTAVPADGFCGAGSMVTGGGVITATGLNVPLGGACEITVTVQVPLDATAATYTNTTSDLTAMAIVFSTAPATDDLIVEAPSSVDVTIAKAFQSSPVLPGGDVILQYTITNNGMVPVDALAFTDDLDGVLTGLAAVGLPANDVCGLGSTLTGTGTVALAGGMLAPSSSCMFDVTVNVPVDAANGTVSSTTGTLTFTAAGQPFSDGTARSDFDVEFLSFAKTFDADPVEPGDTVGLTFMIDNPDPVNAATAIGFTDDLDAVIPGLAATGTPLADVCGGGSSVTGTSLITLADGNLAGGGSCTFTVDVVIPPSGNGTFVNVTSALSADVGGSTVAGDPADAATADVTISNDIIEVPTLGTWGFIALAGLLALFAIGRMRLD